MANNLHNVAEFKMSGQLKLTSNGDGAKSVKVSVVARSGDAIDHPIFGRLVHDFAGMTHKARIPLDNEHCEPIGYLSNFDTSTGDLVCSGAIVIADDDIQTIVTLMMGGVPYEASIAHDLDDDCLMQFIPEGATVNVNKRDIAGPVTVVRQWELDAVAVCKLGADDDTSTELQMSQKNTQESKGFFMKISKTPIRENHMSQEIEKKVEAVEAPVETAPAVVDTAVKASDTQLSAQSVETAPAVVEANIAEVIAQAKEEVKLTAPAVEVASVEFAKPESVDPRAEFKRFVAEFGKDKAAEYYGEGKSFTESMALFVKDVQSENVELKKRLAAIDRGAAQPLAFSDSMKRDESAKPQGMAAVIRHASDKKTRK